jgi:hypothetical protein
VAHESVKNKPEKNIVVLKNHSRNSPKPEKLAKPSLSKI